MSSKASEVRLGDMGNPSSILKSNETGIIPVRIGKTQTIRGYVFFK